MSKIAAIIPARMNSSRFPGKPLAPLLGRPMIEHVVRRAELCRHLDEVLVATPDQEIKEAVELFGGKAVITSLLHERASDRVAEAAKNVEAEIIVMIQGDEPMVTPQMISEAVKPMIADRTVECVNLVYRITNSEDFKDFNTIKVVMNNDSEAVYFSRAPIPFVDFDKSDSAPIYKQVCVIPFRREALINFAELAPTLLERAESIDMLRFIEHKRRIRLIETEIYSQAVDTPDDLIRVERLLENDPLILEYLD